MYYAEYFNLIILFDPPKTQWKNYYHYYHLIDEETET